MAEIPTTTYDYEIATLIKYYEQALLDVNSELMSIDLTNFQRAQATALQKSVADILKELDEKSAVWVEENVPIAVTDGIIQSLIALEVAETVEEAQTILKFNRLNKDLVKTVVADTQEDLLQVTQNVTRKVRTAIREVTADVLRSNVTQGVNATASLKRDIIRELRTRLGDSLNTGIVDASNRRWRPQVYVEMVVRTKMASAQREAAINDGVLRGALYGVISRHGATDACRNWEGKIVKLSRDAEGDYPYIGDLPRREIFHPNCRHVISPVRRIDRLPEGIRAIN